jgi:hypothetical protein
MSNCNECILCLDEKKNEQLIYNNRCTCKYYYHASCWSKMEKNKCVMCNIEYNNSTFLVDSPYRQASTTQPIIVQLESSQIQPVELRIQILQQQQDKNEYICCISSVGCLIIIMSILMGIFYLK